MVRNWLQRNGITLIVKPVTSMASVSPIGENRDRRTVILDAALEVFANKGFHAASVDDVATAAGVSKPIVYQFFTSKHALYVGLLSRSVALMTAGVEEAISSASVPRLRVTAALAYYFDAVDRADMNFRLIFESDFTTDPEVKVHLEEFLSRVTRFIGVEIAEATGLPVGNANILAAGITGMAQQSAWRWIRLGRPVAKEVAVAHISELVWHGLSAFPAE